MIYAGGAVALACALALEADKRSPLEPTPPAVRLSGPRLATPLKPIAFRKGERIALVGNATAERMSRFGHFETMLHWRFAQEELVVRNFGWPADEVGLQQRPSNYTEIDDPLEIFSPDTFICFFGFNESFSTDPLSFSVSYERYLDRMTSRFTKNGSPPRFILVSPVAFEPSGNPHQPSGDDENGRLRAITEAIHEVAGKREHFFAPMFEETRSLFLAEEGLQHTINGVHLNEVGDLAVSRLLYRSLFNEDFAAEIGSSELEKLRDAINDKAWVHANDYRMLNGLYVYGERRT